MDVRKPNAEEKEELAKLSAVNMSGDDYSEEDLETTRGHVEGSAIAVFDHYITDSPGYAGKLMSVVWPASPDFYEVYIWRDGKIKRLNQEAGLRIEEEDSVIL